MIRSRVLRAAILACVSVFTAAAQGRPPVVLLNGYQGTCGIGSDSSGVFGELQQLLAAQGLTVYYFDNCTVTSPSGRPTIEQIAQAFGTFLAGLNTPEVDAVGHSMGGLILRTYLAGLQPSGEFLPPAQTRIRKAVFVATPNYGALALAYLFDVPPIDAQLNELLPGSAFEWRLNTGNQGSYDFRGIDAIALVGNNAGGGSSDGAVPVTSASLAGFMGPDRTQVIPYCHVADAPSFDCSGPGIAKVTSSSHLGYLIINSFLAGTNDWQSVGHSASQDPVLSRNGGVDIAIADQNGNISTSITAVKAPLGPLLGNAISGIFFGDLLPAGNYNFAVSGGEGLPSGIALQAPVGFHQPLLAKAGPRIDSIESATGRLSTLSRAPGMLVSIYGAALSGASVSVAGQTASVAYSSDTQINTVLPASLSGVVPLTVSSPAGSHSINLFVEAVVPALFSEDGTGAGNALALRADGSIVSASNPCAPGELISLVATGLGVSPLAGLTVSIGGFAATVSAVTSIGNGVNLVNVTVPAQVAAPVPVTVNAGAHTSNSLNLAIAAP